MTDDQLVQVAESMKSDTMTPVRSLKNKFELSGR